MIQRYWDMIPETELDIINRNLAPFYFMQLLTVESVEEFERECLKLEIKKFCAPPRRSIAYVAPDLPCVSVETEFSALSLERSRSDSRGYQPFSARSSPKCY